MEVANENCAWSDDRIAALVRSLLTTPGASFPQGDDPEE